MTPMDNLINIVSSFKADLIKNSTQYSRETILNVAAAFETILLRKKEPEDHDYISVNKSLIINDDILAPKSISNLECYNDFVVAINKTRLAKFKFFNHPLKANRHLIIHLDKQKLRHVEYIGVIRRELSQLNSRNVLRDADDSQRKAFLKDIRQASNLYATKLKNDFSLSSDNIDRFLIEEIDYTCSFVAAASIFGIVVLPKFHISLLNLPIKDVSTSPVSIRIHFKGADTFYRYFLPFPASAYFMRYVLYHEDMHRKFHGRRKRRQNDLINMTSLFSSTRFAAIFKRWTHFILSSHGFKDFDGFKPSQFHQAALAESIINAGSDVLKAPSYPPFVLSAQSRKIKSYSLSGSYLFHLSNALMSNSLQEQFKRQKKKRVQSELTPLGRALSALSKIRMQLEKTAPTLQIRKSTAQRLLNDVISRKGSLDANDFFNLQIYTKWIASMLSDSSYKKISSINDYASMVPSLLYKLSGKEAIHRVEPAKLDEYMRLTLIEYGNRSIRDHLIRYCKFVKKELGNGFTMPDWSKKDLKKEEIPTPKTFISYQDIDKVLEMCDSKFKGYLKRIKSIEHLKKEEKRANHKVKLYRLIIILAFFTGLRISEILKLKLKHIIYSDGYVLTIRYSKTRNGIRNIPLNILLPSKYLEEFNDYLRYIRTRTMEKRYLFPRLDSDFAGYSKKVPVTEYSPLGVIQIMSSQVRSSARLKRGMDYEKFDNSTIRKEVQELFESLGYAEFVFHHLRHSFANWFLLRWFAAFHQDKIPSDTPFLDNELFQEKYLDKLRGLLLGYGYENRIGQKSFSHVLAALARIMGHGGPVVTLETYLHVVDWLYYLLSKNSELKVIDIKPKMAKSFLQVTFPTYSKIQKQCNNNLLKDPMVLIQCQRDQLPKCYR